MDKMIELIRNPVASKDEKRRVAADLRLLLLLCWSDNDLKPLSELLDSQFDDNPIGFNPLAVVYFVKIMKRTFQGDLDDITVKQIIDVCLKRLISDGEDANMTNIIKIGEL